MSNAFLVFGSFFIVYLMLFGLLILKALNDREYDFPDADQELPSSYFPQELQR